jgi:two-component system sensor histidine kinase PilS (NtrC family)
MQDNIFIKLLVAFLLMSSGLLIGIFLVPYLYGAGIQVLLSIGIFLIVIAAYSAVRIYIVTQRKDLKTSGGRKEKSEVGFVVDTFQELVGKLKEKEKELDKLKSLAEDRAVRMETYNENILQSVPSGVVSIDNSMKIKSINQSAERALGIKAEDVIDKDCTEVFDEPLMSIVRDSKTVHRGEYPYVTRDNRHIWLGVTTSQLKNTANETIGLILVFTDLTDVKTLQVQVELKERLAQLGEMSAGIAHELRNPMSVIAGYAKLLNKKVKVSDKAIVNAILTEIENIDRIISEFLVFAKPTDLNKASIDLNRMIEETVATAIGDDETIKVLIKAENPVSIMADEVLLRQAITNLFINAVEAMPEGGNLDIELDYLQDRVEINIKDTGHGIPEDIKQKMFLPFYTSKQKGIGLGLAIVQKVIVSHGGSIEVDSKEGEGTIFSITLPAMS